MSGSRSLALLFFKSSLGEFCLQPGLKTIGWDDDLRYTHLQGPFSVEPGLLIQVAL